MTNKNISYVISHPLTNVCKLAAWGLGWYFFGWQLALVLFLLGIEMTARKV